MFLGHKFNSTCTVGIFYAVLLAFACFCLTSCGGGGGGGSSADAGNANNRNAAQGVRIIHAALDFGPLELYANGAASLISVDTAKFAEVSYHGRLETGLQNLNLSAKSNPANSYWAASIDQQSSQRKTILVYGGYKDVDLRVAVIEDSPAVPERSFAYVRFLNGITNSSSAGFSIPNIVQSSTTNPGTASAYVPVAAGTYDFLVNSPSGVIGKTTGAIEAGKAYSVVGQGAAGYLVSANLLED